MNSTTINGHIQLARNAWHHAVSVLRAVSNSYTEGTASQSDVDKAEAEERRAYLTLERLEAMAS